MSRGGAIHRPPYVYEASLRSLSQRRLRPALSLAVIPPQMPSGWLVSMAKARQSSETGQDAQTDFARLTSAGSSGAGKKSTPGVPEQAAASRQLSYSTKSLSWIGTSTPSFPSSRKRHLKPIRSRDMLRSCGFSRMDRAQARIRARTVPAPGVPPNVCGPHRARRPFAATCRESRKRRLESPR